MPKSHCELTVRQINARQRLYILKWRKEQKKQEKIDWIAENEKINQSQIGKFIINTNQLTLF